jgi:hypothetical protein
MNRRTGTRGWLLRQIGAGLIAREAETHTLDPIDSADGGFCKGDLEIGGVVAFISGIGRLNDPWGDLVNYFRDLSVTEVKFKLLTSAATRPIPALLTRVPAGD